MSKELAIQIEDTQLQNELSIDDLVSHVEKIQDIMKSVMVQDVHYGKIPGVEKKILYKAGAEKLGFTFRLIPEFEIARNDLDNGHREYEIICTLKNMITGVLVGQGVGNCSTMESKYRYRNDYIDTGRAVPKAYWKDRDSSLLGGKNFVTKKVDGQWMIFEKSGKIENPDIADTYNTVLKLAKKRAHVDSIITACAVSDLVTQDLNENKEDDKAGKSGKKKTKPTEKTERQEILDNLRVVLLSGYFEEEEIKTASGLVKQKTTEQLKGIHLQYKEEEIKRQREDNNGASQAFDGK